MDDPVAIHRHHIHDAYNEVYSDFHRVKQLNFCLYGPWRHWVESTCKDFGGLLVRRHSSICGAALEKSSLLKPFLVSLRNALEKCGGSGWNEATEFQGLTDAQMIIRFIASLLSVSPALLLGQYPDDRCTKIESKELITDSENEELSTNTLMETKILSTLPCECFSESVVIWAECNITVVPKDYTTIKSSLSYIATVVKQLATCVADTQRVNARQQEAKERFLTDYKVFEDFLRTATDQLLVENVDGSVIDPFAQNTTPTIAVPLVQHVTFRSMHFAPIVPTPTSDEGRYAFETVIDVTDSVAAKQLPKCFHCGPFAPQCCIGPFLGFAVIMKYLHQDRLRGSSVKAPKRTRNGDAISQIPSLNGPVVILGMGGNVAANLLCEQLLAPTPEAEAFLSANPQFSIHVVEIEPAVMATCARNGLLPGYEHLQEGDEELMMPKTFIPSPSSSGKLTNFSGFRVSRTRNLPSWCARHSKQTEYDTLLSQYRTNIQGHVFYHIGVDALSHDLTLLLSPTMATNRSRRRSLSSRTNALASLILLDCFDPMLTQINNPHEVLLRFKAALQPDAGILCVNAHFPPDVAATGKPFCPFLDVFNANQAQTVHAMQYNALSQFFIVSEMHSPAAPGKETMPVKATLSSLQSAISDLIVSNLFDRLISGVIIGESLKSSPHNVMKALPSTVTYDWGLRKVIQLDVPREEAEGIRRVKLGLKRAREVASKEQSTIKLPLWCA